MNTSEVMTESTLDAPTETLPRVPLFGVEIHVATMQEAVAEVWRWIASPGKCRFVVTPNVDHVVMLQERNELRLAYEDAALVLADGWPVVAASRLLRKALPERVPGSDLVPCLFDKASETRPLQVYLLGAEPGVGERAAERLQRRWPHVSVCGTFSPPLGFEHDAQQSSDILGRIAEAKPDVLIVGLGAPKQELWVHRHQDQIAASAALCVGATIDFLAAHRRRAPRWVQRCGLEWFHRLASEPRRLFKRYARDAVIFPQIVLKSMLR